MKFATTFALLAVLLVAASEAFVLRDEPVVIIFHDGKITKIPVSQLPECYHKLQSLLEEYVTKEQVTTEQMTKCSATIVNISECFDKYNSILYKITQRITATSQKIDVCLLDAIQPAAAASSHLAATQYQSLDYNALHAQEYNTPVHNYTAF